MLGHGLFVRWLLGALVGSSLIGTLFLSATALAQALPEQPQDQPLVMMEPIAGSCSGATNGRAVLLSFGERVDASLADAVRADLTAELERRGIGVCTPDATPETLLARVSVDIDESGRVVLAISDHVTDKQVTRDVSLSHLPESGRALAIAIAIDELLRASWAELSLASKPEPKEPPPPVEEKPRTEEPAAPVDERNAWLSLQGSYAGIPDRYNSFGGQLAFDMLPWRALWLDVRLGAARALERDVGPGAVSIVALSTHATLGACLPAARAALLTCLGASVLVDVLSLHGEAEPGRVAKDAVEPLVSSAATLTLIAPITSRLMVTGSASLGTTLSGVRISDGENTLLALEGLLFAASLGMGVSL